MYDPPFFYIFLWMDEANLANQKIVKRNLVGRELSHFFTGEMSWKSEIENFEKKAILEVLSSQKWEEKKGKNRRMHATWLALLNSLKYRWMIRDL